MGMFENLARVMEPSSTLKIRCLSCDHQAEWSRKVAFKALGSDAAPYEIRRRIRCGDCGEQARIEVWI